MVETEREASVYFIGAGPGALDLLTLRAQRIIQRADLVLYADSLVDPAIATLAKPGAEVVGSADLTLDEIVGRMVAAAKAGLVVARVHSGDPSIFGAIHEQMAALEAAGVGYVIVPGVSSLFAAAAALGVELTVPGISQTVIISRAAGRTPVPERERLRDLAAHRATLAIFLSAGMVEEVVAQLVEGGFAPSTPAAVVYRATWPDQQIVRGVLREMCEAVPTRGIARQAIILVGDALSPSHRRDRPATSRLYDPAFGHGRRVSRTTLERRGARCQVPTGDGSPAAEGGPGDPQGPAGPPSASGVASTPGSAEARCQGVSRPERTALAAVSRPGSELALRLQPGLPGSEAFLPERFSPTERAGVNIWARPLKDLLRRLFAEYGRLVLFGSVGIWVRLVAPLARDKHGDPAVVVVDDAGRFAVSLLSGHLGGANDLARRVADLLGAEPVITAGSEALGTLAVDLLGRELGWRLEMAQNVTRVSAAVVNGETVGLLQEAGEPDWRPRGRPLPANWLRVSTLEELAASRCQAALIITDRTISGWEDALPPSVVYRPRSLVVGVGCNRDTSAEEIAAAVAQALEGQGLALASIRKLATVDLKRDEQGLQRFAAGLGVPVEYYSPQQLSSVAGTPNPSEAVMRCVGTTGVCEPAALLGSGASTLVVPKLKTPNVTVAVARMDFSKRVGSR